MLDKYGMDVSGVTSYKDMDPFLAEIKEKEPGVKPVISGAIMLSGMTPFMQGVPEYENLGDGIGVLMGSDSWEVVDVFETQEYADLCADLHTWYKAGYISEDCGHGDCGQIRGKLWVGGGIQRQPDHPFCHDAVSGVRSRGFCVAPADLCLLQSGAGGSGAGAGIYFRRPVELSGNGDDAGRRRIPAGDRIFLTYSASAAGACYCMGMLSIDADGDLLDPRVRKKERFPVLRTDGEKGVFGPGHNSFVRAEDGTTDLCFYHARQYDEITGDPLYDPNRHTMVLALAYDNTGRPVFEIPKR